MRKTSWQILEEILIQRELNKLSAEERVKFDGYLDDLLHFKKNEYDSLIAIAEYSNRFPSLSKFIQNKLMEHTKNILAKLGGLTMDQFEQKIKEEEEKFNKYQQLKGIQ